jgi:hypothetical protein
MARLDRTLPMGRSPWKVDDAVWVKERKAAWTNDVQHRVKLLFKHFDMYYEEDVQMYKEYYHTGVANRELVPAPSLFLLSWLHPEPTLENWRNIKLALKNKLGYSRDCEMLQTAAGYVGFVQEGYKGGLLEDLTYPMYQFLLFDNAFEWDIPPTDRCPRLRAEWPKSDYIQDFLYFHNSWVSSNSLTQYFIEDWYTNLSTKAFEIETKKSVEKLFYALLNYSDYVSRTHIDCKAEMKFNPSAEVVTQKAISFDPDEHNNPLLAKVSTQLLEMMETRTFPAEALELWEDCKRTYIEWIINAEKYLYDRKKGLPQLLDDTEDQDITFEELVNDYGYSFIAEPLHKYGVIQEDQMYPRMALDAETPCMYLEFVAPHRVINYGDMTESPGTYENSLVDEYAKLIVDYVNASNGQIHIDNLQTHENADFVIEFDCDGKHEKWTFEEDMPEQYFKKLTKWAKKKLPKQLYFCWDGEWFTVAVLPEELIKVLKEYGYSSSKLPF